MSARRVTLDDDHQLLPPTTSFRRRKNSSIGSTSIKQTPTTPATPAPIESPPYSPLVKDWEREYRILKEAYQRQERRLTALQQENEALRQKVDQLSSVRDDCTEADHENYTPSSTSAQFSPGTKFVAELVEVMELDVGHHALLSSIVDRQHGEEQREARRRCSM